MIRKRPGLLLTAALSVLLMLSLAKAEDPRVVVVVLDSVGTIRVGDVKLTTSEFQKMIASVIQKYGYGIPVQVRTDPACPYAAVVGVLNTCLDAQLWTVYLADNEGRKRIYLGAERPLRALNGGGQPPASREGKPAREP